MQSLRAPLLLVVISTTLFHLASTGDALAPVNAEIAKGNNATGQVIAGANEEIQRKGEEFDKTKKATEEEFGKNTKAVGDAACKATGGSLLPGCPASAISNLLSLAVVIVVGLFSR